MLETIDRPDTTDSRQAYRGRVVDFAANPMKQPSQALRYREDGLLLVENGRIAACGDYTELADSLGDDLQVVDYRPSLILPGFIDTHVHYGQVDIVASHADQLLDWLTRFTYPAEARLSDPLIARDTAGFFVEQLLANGTTTAMVFATSQAQSVDALFAQALQRRLCLISGKVLMDRNAPANLLDTADSAYRDSRRLIDQWHGKDRLRYAVTPRFAPTSSEPQLRMAQRLVNEFPDLYLQSHVAENRGEIDWVAELFPWARSYLDVYDHFGLLGERCVYAHCIHLDDQDRQRLVKSDTSVAFCPSSNLFLGSGLFDLQAALTLGLRLGLGSDVGAGTRLSLFTSMRDAYKVARITGVPVTPSYYFYLATRGGAEALLLDDRLGHLEAGSDADFIVVDPYATAAMQRRLRDADDIEDLLFALMMLGDDRSIESTFIMGECRYRRQRQP